MRILPIPAPSSSAAMTTSAFFSVCRPRTPSSSPPTQGLVDLCAASEPFAARPHHRAPQLVQQRPGGAVASQTQNALQSQSTRPGFLARHPPHRPIPGAQRQTRILENRARRQRSLIIALSTAQQAPPTTGPSSLSPTAGARKTPRPAQLHQILATRLLSDKTPLKLLQRPRVVLHEPAYYMLGLRESSAYPPGGVVDKYLLPTRPEDESVTLWRTEPFHGTCFFHCFSPLLLQRDPRTSGHKSPLT